MLVNDTVSAMRLIILLLVSLCLAEVIKCPDGVWREGDCSSKPREARPTIDSDLSERRRIYTDLDLEAFRARRDGRGDVDLSKAREDCLSEKATLETCKATVNAELDKIKSVPTPILQLVDQSVETTQVIVVNEENNYIRPTSRPEPTKPPHYVKPTEVPKKHSSLRGRAIE